MLPQLIYKIHLSVRARSPSASQRFPPHQQHPDARSTFLPRTHTHTLSNGCVCVCRQAEERTQLQTRARVKTHDVITFTLCKAEIHHSGVQSTHIIPRCDYFLWWSCAFGKQLRLVLKTRQRALARRLRLTGGKGSQAAISSFSFQRGSSRIAPLNGPNENFKSSLVRLQESAGGYEDSADFTLHISCRLSNTLYLFFAHDFLAEHGFLHPPRITELLEDVEYKPTHNVCTRVPPLEDNFSHKVWKKIKQPSNKYSQHNIRRAHFWVFFTLLSSLKRISAIYTEEDDKSDPWSPLMDEWSRSKSRNAEILKWVVYITERSHEDRTENRTEKTGGKKAK